MDFELNLILSSESVEYEVVSYAFLDYLAARSASGKPTNALRLTGPSDSTDSRFPSSCLPCPRC